MYNHARRNSQSTLETMPQTPLSVIFLLVIVAQVFPHSHSFQVRKLPSARRALSRFFRNGGDLMNSLVILPKSATVSTPPKDTITRIYSGDDGQSHIEFMPMDLQPFLDIEGAHGVGTMIENAKSIEFRTTTPSYDHGWHNAPRRQYVILLQGRAEIEIGDGSKVIASAGDVLLAEDLTGQGHMTRVADEGESFSYAIVAL